jgi:IS4 transposase
MNKKNKPAKKSPYTVLNQICNLIPPLMVPNLAREHGVDKKSRTFSPWSHVVSLMYAHLSHAFGLNDVCDAMGEHAGKVWRIREATPPRRNTFSHANAHRDSAMAEALYWKMRAGCSGLSEKFVLGGRREGFLRRLKKPIFAMDSTTIALVANCMPWAKHRRKKAAVKCHLSLNLQNHLPQAVCVEKARPHDSRFARFLCNPLRDGSIVVADKAYVDFRHFRELTEDGIVWVVRARRDTAFRAVRSLHTTDNPRILADEVVVLARVETAKKHPEGMRRIRALVEIDGKDRKMEFLTNQMDWSAWTVAELYRCRWDVEVFFKEIKQTLQLSDFLGNSEHAIKWQIWCGLLVHLLLRFLHYLSQWTHSFFRLFALLRACLWDEKDLHELLRLYGTASSPPRWRARPEQAYFPGFP